MAEEEGGCGIIPLPFSTGPEGLRAGSASSMWERWRRRGLESLREMELFPCLYHRFWKDWCSGLRGFLGSAGSWQELAGSGGRYRFQPLRFPLLRGHWKTAALVRAFDNFVPVVGVNTADYNALFGEKRVHQYGGRQFHAPASQDACQG